MNVQEEEKKLSDFIGEHIPDFKNMIDAAAEEVEHNSNFDGIVMHQDAFAADYQEEEFILLGKAIKYAGMKKVPIRFIGENRSTLDSKDENRG